MNKLFLIPVMALMSLHGSILNLNAQDMKEANVPQNLSAFPIGEPNSQYARFFIGQSYLAPLTRLSELNCPVSNVTFEPACRNNWHRHTGGQLLIAVGGKGFYQARGEKARLLLPGDVVEIPADVEHWHGAAPDSWFSHLAVTCNPQTNENTWLEPVNDAEYEEATREYRQSAGSLQGKYAENDPDLAEIVNRFMKTDVATYGQIDEKTCAMVTLASNIATQSQAMYQLSVGKALDAGVTPTEIKEVLYQAVAYVGLAKVFDFIPLTNHALAARGVKLPLESQATATADNRFEKGLALQKSIFGEQIEKMHETAPENQKHIQRYLSANCFGDYQTRTGLSAKMRELLTFSMLVSLGGCESQVKSHIQGNVNVGNDKATLLTVVTRLLPHIGYPRTLNAIACLNEIIPE